MLRLVPAAGRCADTQIHHWTEPLRRRETGVDTTRLISSRDRGWRRPTPAGSAQGRGVKSEMVADVRLEPARHAGVDLRQAVDRGVVEAHRAVVLVGQILDRCADLELAAGRSVVQAHVREPEARLLD